MAALLKRVFLTIAIVILTGWLLRYSWQQRFIFYRNYTFTAKEAKILQSHPKVQYIHGIKAWLKNDLAEAVACFRHAISQNPFHIDAWLKMAQAQAALGRSDKAKEILKFTNTLTIEVFRWKWKQMLLAHELNMENIFLKNANYLISKNKMVRNTFQLLDTHYSGDINRIAKNLRRDNLVPYLEWLIVWGRLNDTYIVWAEIAQNNMENQDITLRYVHFLVENKAIKKAQSIWNRNTGDNTIINGGFEEEITLRGFDWRYWKNDNWEIKRVKSPVYTGSFALKVAFSGKKNISFYHLYQIIPVEPNKPYLLTFRWKSRQITTDQGPFMEVYGYDTEGLYSKGRMITGTNDWGTETVEFISPENCHAVVVRLRRKPSKRFDCNIAGTIYLDNFKLNLLNKVH